MSKAPVAEEKRQAKIMNLWAALSVLEYTDEDYAAWLSGMDGEAIGIQREIVAEAAKRVFVAQMNFEKACKERRRLKLTQ
jgi:hypothetical protein